MRPILLLFTLALAACGFSLRGSADLPAALQTLQLQAIDASTDIVREMRRTLVDNDITVLDDARPGVYRLGIGNEQSFERVLSVNSNARAGEYAITMSVPFQLRTAEEFIIGPETITLERVYLADPNNAVAKAEEAALIREEMRQDVAAQIMRRLQSLNL